MAISRSSSPLSPTHSLFKTIFWVSKALSPWRTEQWTCTAEFSPMSLTNFHFKTILWVNLSYWLRALTCRRCEQWMYTAVFPSITDEWPFQDHLPSITTVLSRRPLCPVRPDILMCRPVFSSVTNDYPFKTIFKVKLSYQLDELSLMGVQSNECTEQSLPQCHWWMAFSRPSFKVKLLYWLNELCLLGNLNNGTYKAESSSVSMTNGLFKTIHKV